MWKFILILLTVVATSQGTQRRCTAKAVGERAIIPLNYPNLQLDDELKWRQNSTVIISRKKKQFIVGQPNNMMENGSLIISNLHLNHSGIYEAEVHNLNGKLLHQSSMILCVIGKVSQPTVTYSCEEDVVLTCKLEKRAGNVTLQWYSNNETVKEKYDEMLTLDRKTASGYEYYCTARNEVSQERSPKVTVMCGDPGLSTSIVPTFCQSAIPPTSSGHNLSISWLGQCLLLTTLAFVLTTYY